jgi:hypothetical protein
VSGEGHPADCPDCVPCQECETRAAWCLSEHPVNRPCEHLEPICSECWPGSCVPCRLAAEREMFVSGEYDARADPYYDHTRPPPPDPIARDGGYWWDGSWVPVPDPKEQRA